MRICWRMWDQHRHVGGLNNGCGWICIRGKTALIEINPRQVKLGNVCIIVTMHALHDPRPKLVYHLGAGVHDFTILDR